MAGQFNPTLADRLISAICSGALAYVTGFFYGFAVHVNLATVANDSLLKLLPGPGVLIIFASVVAIVGFLAPSAALNLLGWLWARFVSLFRVFQ